MFHSDLIQLAVAYSDSFNSIIRMLCAIYTAYELSRIKNTPQRENSMRKR